MSVATVARESARSDRKRPRIRHILIGSSGFACCGKPYAGERQYINWSEGLRDAQLCVVCDGLYHGPRSWGSADA